MMAVVNCHVMLHICNSSDVADIAGGKEAEGV